jgi:hypothetical protein
LPAAGAGFRDFLAAAIFATPFQMPLLPPPLRHIFAIFAIVIILFIFAEGFSLITAFRCHVIFISCRHIAAF